MHEHHGRVQSARIRCIGPQQRFCTNTEGNATFLPHWSDPPRSTTAILECNGSRSNSNVTDADSECASSRVLDPSVPLQRRWAHPLPALSPLRLPLTNVSCAVVRDFDNSKVILNALSRITDSDCDRGSGGLPAAVHAVV